MNRCGFDKMLFVGVDTHVVLRDTLVHFCFMYESLCFVVLYCVFRSQVVLCRMILYVYTIERLAYLTL